MKSATLVADLGWGDAGKGATVDALSRRLRNPLVVRHHGGPQAAHNVWTKAGLGHTFAQFGSGTLAGAPTHLSRFMLVSPPNWLREHVHLERLAGGDQMIGEAISQTTVEEEAIVITPYHRALNRARERARGAGAHGTTGQGVGEVVMDVLAGRPYLTVGDLRSPYRVDRILGQIRRNKWAEIAEVLSSIGECASAVDVTDANLFPLACQAFLQKVTVVDRSWLAEQERDLIFEGAQGVLLDQDHGFHPHTTWSNCTYENALELIGDLDGPVTKVGVLRSYMTRHGAGPFPTEDPTLDLPEYDNDSQGFAGAWRVGHPDLVMWRYAIAALGGVDYLSLTHLDRLPALDRYAYAYRLKGNRRKCPSACECLCHEPLCGGAHDHRGGPCPGKDQEFAGLVPGWCDPNDLDARTALTESLFNVEPVYDELPPKHVFAEWIEEELGAPARLRANGRTDAARVWVSPTPVVARMRRSDRLAEPVKASLLN